MDACSSDTITKSTNEASLKQNSHIFKRDKPTIAEQIKGRRTKIGNNSSRCPNHMSATKRNQQLQNQSDSAEMTISTFVDMQTETNHDTALTLACVGGHAALASLLIKRGADIEHRDKKGFTPLILAATGGHLETCQILINAGCQIDAQADRTKDTALSLACSGGRKDVRLKF